MTPTPPAEQQVRADKEFVATSPAPPPPGVGGRRTYCMNPATLGGAGTVVVVDETEGGPTARLLPHHVRHSPDGFSWGYEGSGPAELARCILIDVLGDGGKCSTCEGTGRVIYRDQDGPRSVPSDWAAGEPCPDCEADGFALVIGRHYQTFKREVIARHPQGEAWTITADEVRDWLLRQ